MTQTEVIRWARIVSLGPMRCPDEDWLWVQQHAIEFNTRTGLKKELDLERKLLVSKFCEDNWRDADPDEPLSELAIQLMLNAEKSQ
jgi:hypothetical protein